MLIVGPPGPFPLVVFSLVVDNAGVTLTFDQANVTFPAPQFANGKPHQLQICTDGTMASLYSNYGFIGSLPFATGSSTVDLSNAIMFILRNVVTNEIFEVNISYLALQIKIMRNNYREFNCYYM